MIHLPFRFRSAINQKPKTVTAKMFFTSAFSNKNRQQRINWVLGLICLGWSSLLVSCGNTEVTTLGDWVTKSALDGVARSGASSFVVNNIAYVGTGIDNKSQTLKDLWSYDPSINSWEQKANFTGVARYYGVGFSIGNKGYIGTGIDSNGDRLKDFYEYDASGNTWKQISDFGGSARILAVSFSIGNKGYVGTGNDGNYMKDFWAYDPSTDSWNLIAGYGGAKREGAIAFVINNQAYVGTGNNSGTVQKDWHMYDPSTNTWTEKEDFTDDNSGIARSYGVAFAINGKGYVTVGSASAKDVWEYDPTDDTWDTSGVFEGSTRSYAVGFAINGKGYITTGGSGTSRYDDLWQFDPTVAQDTDDY